LQKRPIVLRSLLIVATPYQFRYRRWRWNSTCSNLIVNCSDLTFGNVPRERTLALQIIRNKYHQCVYVRVSYFFYLLRMICSAIYSLSALSHGTFPEVRSQCVYIALQIMYSVYIQRYKSCTVCTYSATNHTQQVSPVDQQ